MHRNFFVCTGQATRKRVPKKTILTSENKEMHRPMSCCSILYPLNLKKIFLIISYCSFVLDRYVRNFFFLRSGHKQGKKKKCWVVRSRTSDLRALMLCNWATETPSQVKLLLHTARINNVESLMCWIGKWWIISSVVNEERCFPLSAFRAWNKEKNWTHHLSYTINSHEAFETADPNSLQDVCHIRA